MAQRRTDTEIWKEEWFINLPNIYKLLFMYIKDNCDYGGIWRVNKTLFQLTCENQLVYLDEFLRMVNQDPDGTPRVRIIQIDKRKWFLPGFVAFQCGKVFKYKIGAHRGALHQIVSNNIHPKDVPGFDWGILQEIDLEEIKKLVYSKTLYTLYIDNGKGMHREREREGEIEREREQEREQERQTTNSSLVIREESVRETKKPDPIQEVKPLNGKDLQKDQMRVIKTLGKKELHEYKEYMLTKDDLFREQIQMACRIKDAAVLGNWIELYHLNLASGPAEKLDKDYTEYKQHFRNWLMKQNYSHPPPNTFDLQAEALREKKSTKDVLSKYLT
jgi:hypothetical protein